VNRIPQSKGGGNKKTSPKATDNSRYAGSFVKRNRRRIIVGREDKSALNNWQGVTEEGLKKFVRDDAERGTEGFADFIICQNGEVQETIGDYCKRMNIEIK
jgi:hypothetical protein